MTLEDLMAMATHDKIAVIFFFSVLPISAFALTKITGREGNVAPYSYAYSFIIFASCIPGVLSATIWGHAMLFESKALWHLDFFIYYLPMVSMIATLYAVNQGAIIRQLPWFGELYELLILIAISFGLIVLVMELEVLRFKAWWHIVLLFLLLFGVLKILWERFLRIAY